MSRHGFESRIACVLLSAISISLSGCSRAVGASDDPDASSGSSDAAGLPDSYVPDGGPTGWFIGWYSTAEEHAGFVLDEGVQPGELASCSTFLTAKDGFENWWVETNEEIPALFFFPMMVSHERAGLVLAEGVLSEPGQYGHMGGYDRKLHVTWAELLLCETVQATRHCLVPRSGDCCVLPEPTLHETRTYSLSRTIGGDYYELMELWVEYNEHIDDAGTSFSVSFRAPLGDGPKPDDWQPLTLDMLDDVQLREVRSWGYYEEIDYPSSMEGWLLRQESSDSYRLSISGRSGSDTSLHIWGDFVVTETFYAP